MIYGRRLMQNKPDPRPVPGLSRLSRAVRQSDTARLTFQFFILSFVMQILLVGPALFFVRQNYHIFEGLALQTQTPLFKHLEGEMTWLLGFGFFGVILGSSLLSFFFHRIVSHMAKPLEVANRWMSEPHLETFTQKDLSEMPHGQMQTFLRDLVEMKERLQAQNQIELDLLNQISISTENRASFESWNELKQIKRQQLNQSGSQIISFSDSASSQQKRHAS